MGVSLDGIVARPGRGGAVGGDRPDDPALKKRKLDWMREIDFHLMGRKTYEEMAEFWPNSDDAYAAPMNDIPKVVFSKTLARADWPESTIASSRTTPRSSGLRLSMRLKHASATSSRALCS